MCGFRICAGLVHPLIGRKRLAVCAALPVVGLVCGKEEVIAGHHS